METISTLAHRHGEAPGELPPRQVLDTAGDVLRALAAPLRIAIVLHLLESQRCVHELVDHHLAHIVTAAVTHAAEDTP